MIDSIYEPFKKWCEKGRVYIYSDPHFFESGLTEEELMMRNKFHYEVNDVQVNNINKYLNKNDTLVFLGDIGNPEPIKNIKAGYKVCLLGNHDTSVGKLRDYFDEIYKGALFISDKILLSHEPLREVNCAYNIFGHIHNIEEVDGFCLHKEYACVSANLIGYRPICLDQLCKGEGEFKEKEIFLGNIKSIHRRTIDNAINRKWNKHSLWQRIKLAFKILFNK